MQPDVLIQGLEKLEYRGYDSLQGFSRPGGAENRLVKEAVGRNKLSAKDGW